jgi:hypothetical protein
MQLLIMQFSPASCHFLSLFGPNILLRWFEDYDWYKARWVIRDRAKRRLRSKVLNPRSAYV